MKYLNQKYTDLNKNIEELKQESDKFKSVENSLIETLKTAEDTGKNIIEKAKEDVSSTIDDSKERT